MLVFKTKTILAKIATPLLALGLAAPAFSHGDHGVEKLLDSEHRSEANRARDQYRNPAETLDFFELAPEQTVVEIWPGGGWYAEILAPYIKGKGTYYAAHFDPNSGVNYFSRSLAKFKDKMQAEPEVYGETKLSAFFPPNSANTVKGEADRVLTFRNVHNWMKAGYAEKAFAEFYAMLKPGGILGVVEHRAKPGTSLEDMTKSGYVTEDHVLDLAKQAGFKFLAASEINANDKDGAKHPKGVWTLPPRLALGEQDQAKYKAIGESDRMTLKFIKPAK
ncbi:MAG: methyltransferase [Cellvibrionaceae bacterium]|nr:methyltransferase [Cellvibrionaceae bacterium]MCV6624762.1 methyltransferase [Cellvibrionaceae bacterium]